jgi:DNA-binding response OmpR family regulator/DNA-directed RNA polymerase subunit RPC12/RpoP
MEKQKILIVDDDEQIRSMYAEMLRENGFDIIERNDGAEGLEVATSEKVDGIMTGIIMPRMNGFDFVKALKEYKETADIPIIVNSHLGREEDRIAMEKLGVNDFIIRGLVSPAEIIKRIISVIKAEDYFLKVDKEALDMEKFMREQGMPDGFVCDNCGTELAIKFKKTDKDYFRGSVRCPNCNKRFN